MGAQNQKATGLPTIEAPSNWPPPTSGALNANSPVAGGEDGSALAGIVLVVCLPVEEDVALPVEGDEAPHPASVTLVSAIANPTLTSDVRKDFMAAVLQIIPGELRAPSTKFRKGFA